MAIKKRVTQVPAATSADDDLDRKAEAFGIGAVKIDGKPIADVQELLQEEGLDPDAPVGPQGIMLRFNAYQRKLLEDEKRFQRRSGQKILEMLVWPELEKRRDERLIQKESE